MSVLGCLAALASPPLAVLVVAALAVSLLGVWLLGWTAVAVAAVVRQVRAGR